MLVISFAAALSAAVLYATGSVLQAAKARGRSTAALVRSPLYLVGLGCDGLAWLLSLIALRGLPVFAVQALLAGSLALTVLLARLFLRVSLGRRDVAAVVVMAAALSLIGTASPGQSPAGASPAVVVGLTAAAALCLLAVGVLRRAPSAAQAVLAGLAFSVAALAARAVESTGQLWLLATRPLAWAVLVSGVAGTLAYAGALQRGSVGPATALMWAVEVVVPAALGILVLGDAVRHGWLPVAAVCVAAVACTAVVLATSPDAA